MESYVHVVLFTNFLLKESLEMRLIYMLCSITAEAILSKVQEAGFTVSLSKETRLTKEMAEQLYHEQKGKEFFNDLTDLMSR